MGYLGANLSAGVNARSRRMYRSQMSESKSQIENCDLGMWMTSCTGSARGGFWGFWRKSVSWVLRSEEEGWLLRARSGLVAGATRFVGADGKASIERLYLSPYVEKPLNLKVIKSFVPELRSHYVFFVFRDSYVLCIYVMNILCTFHIFVSGYGTTWPFNLHKTIFFVFNLIIMFRQGSTVRKSSIEETHIVWVSWWVKNVK